MEIENNNKPLERQRIFNSEEKYQTEDSESAAGMFVRYSIEREKQLEIENNNKASERQRI